MFFDGIKLPFENTDVSNGRRHVRDLYPSLVAATQQYKMVFIIEQYGENERCNSNDLFRVPIFVVTAQWFVNEEISSQMENREFDEIKIS
jgi:hypothetical protein